MREPALWVFRSKAFEIEGTASANVLRWSHA